MSYIRDWGKFFDKLMRVRQQDYYRRSEGTQDNLIKVVIRMEQRKSDLGIPDSAIRIVSYFARNDRALIIPDANVRQAFHHALRAMNM